MDLRLYKLLVGAVPLLTQPPPLPPLFTHTAQGTLVNWLTGGSADATRLVALMQVMHMQDGDVPPRPAQGGQRITEQWLCSLSNRDCLWRFKMDAQELLEMTEALEIPESMMTAGRYKFTGLEAFCLLCARFRSAGDQYTLSIQYDRSQSSISECVNELVEYLDEKWEHLLATDSEYLLHPTQLARYAKAIHDRGSPLKSIFGFIDCTIRRICHPTWFQRVAYNGHKKFHALKYQAVMLPNGIIGHLHGPFEGRRNDNFLLTESGLLDRLAEFAYQDVEENQAEDAPLEERTFQIFGDPAYGLGRHIISPYSGVGERTAEEKEWNAKMSAVRIEVEHGFGIVSNTWPFLNAGWKMKLYASPVGRYYRVGVLLVNCLNCLRPNQVAQYFECEPPELQDYLHH